MGNNTHTSKSILVTVYLVHKKYTYRKILPPIDFDENITIKKMKKIVCDHNNIPIKEIESVTYKDRKLDEDKPIKDTKLGWTKDNRVVFFTIKKCLNF